MSETIHSAMLMTAGLGTRLKPFTLHCSKAVLPLMGIPMVQYSVDALISAGVYNIVANVHHLPKETTHALSSLDLKGGKLHLSDESSVILGSSGGIKKALPLLTSSRKEPFFLANADVICNVDWTALSETHHALRRKHGVSLTLAISPGIKNQNAYREIQYDPTTSLISKLGDLQMGKPFYIGAAVLEPEAVAELGAGASEFVPAVLAPAVAAKKAGVFVTNELWLDIGTPSTWLNAHLAMLELLEKNSTNTNFLLWKKRIESLNTRVAPRIWASSHALGHATLARAKGWIGPAYWAGTGAFPQKFGPQAVLYGPTPPASQALDRGIGFSNHWVPSSAKT